MRGEKRYELVDLQYRANIILSWSEVQVYPENVEFKEGERMKGCPTNEKRDSEPFVTSGIKSLQGIKGTLEIM